MNDSEYFVHINDVTVLLPLLESRLPRSSHVYNMAIMYPKFRTEMKFHVTDRSLKPDTWIVVTYDREDYGNEVNISAPNEPEITPKIKNAFANSSLIDWTKTYSFAEIDRPVSVMLFEISALLKGNKTSFTPCHLYYIHREEALKLDIRHENPETEVKSLNTCLETGAQFMYDTCQHKSEGTMEYIENLIKKCPTVGVFKNGELISGAITVANGPMGFLYTLETHRNNNYGKLSMHSLMQEQARNGFVPCSAVEITNITSNQFHQKIGMKISHAVDYINNFQ